MRVNGEKVDPSAEGRRPARQPQVHTPAVGAKVSVQLRGETTRGTVAEVLNPRSLVVKLDVMEPMAKTHGFYFGDNVVVVLKKGLGGLPLWEATKKVV